MLLFFNGTQCSIGQDYIILMDVYQPTNSIHTMQLGYHYITVQFQSYLKQYPVIYSVVGYC